MTALLALVLSLPCFAQAPKDLPEAQSQARRAIADADPDGAALRRGLGEVADALQAGERTAPGEEEEEGRSLREISRESRAALKKARPRVDKRLAPALDALEKFYKDLPSRSYAQPWGEDLQRIVAEQLRWSGERAKSAQELDDHLAAVLTLPKTLPGEADVEDLAFWPVDVPLPEFKKLDPIRVFLMKHRIKRPARYAQTTAASIVDGHHAVETGVAVEGVVTWNTKGREFDQDYCFNIGDLHVEMTPEWRLKHPKILRPKVGDRVRLRGWTYYDYFHKAEHEWDPQDPRMGEARATLWEIHPVQDVEKLP